MALPYWMWGKEALFNRLMARFSLELSPRDPTAYLVHRSVQPVTDADELLRTLSIKTFNVAIPGASAYVTMATIPSGERWKLRSAFYSTNSGTVEQLRMSDGTNIAMLHKVTAAASLQTNFDGQEINAKEGWIIDFYYNHTGAGTLTLVVLVEVEKAY